GISDSMYSFSLSFLAVSFLVMSFLLSFVKQISSHMKAFALGLSFYVLYLLLFSTSSNIYTVLMSYVFLAIGQTMMGIIETNYFQLSLNMKELQKLYIYSETLHSVFSGIAVLVIGSFAFLSSHLVLVFRSLAVFALFILLCYCVFVNLKKLSIDK
ncbi:MFS transporter, partial [Streptococcus thermophilus]|nr:MFS transporter [Streptococcus thermophilus]